MTRIAASAIAFLGALIPFGVIVGIPSHMARAEPPQETQLWMGQTITETGQFLAGEAPPQVYDFKGFEFPEFFIGFPPHEIFIEKLPPPCLVLSAQLIYGGRVHAPLSFPSVYASPRPVPAATPGVQRQTSGPSVGPIPATNPVVFNVSTSFEYHSDLNGIHGCSSEQKFKEIVVRIQKGTGWTDALHGQPLGPGIGAQAPWRSDASHGSETYRGNTHTGTRPGQPRNRRGIPLGAPGNVYRGSPQVIHWLDSPSAGFGAGSFPDSFAVFRVLLLDSRTYNSDRQHGWHCLSGHSVMIDGATGGPMDAADARDLLDLVRPAAGSNAPPEVRRVMDQIRTPRNQGGFGAANPEFRELGCFPF